MARVTIVGAGIHGLSTAWAATKHGHAVTLLERGPIPNPLAASGDHHRIIRRAYGTGNGYGAAISEAYAAWDEMWGDLGARLLDPRGFLLVSREPGDPAEDLRDGLAQGGWPFEMLGAREAARRWPFLDADAIRWAALSPEGGALHCRRIAARLVRFLRAQGATVREQAPVLAVEPEAGAVRLADGTRIEADRLVVTVGAWTPRLLPHLDLPLTVWRTAVAYLEPPADLRAAWEASPVILDVGGETDGYVIPPSGDGGLKFGSGLHRRLAPEGDADAGRAAEPGEGEAIRDLFAPPMRRLHDYRVLSVASCAYAFTPDERFVAAQDGRMLAVSACSGHGYKFGAAVGRRVAAWLDDGDTAGLTAWLRAEESILAPSRGPALSSGVRSPADPEPA